MIEVQNMLPLLWRFLLVLVLGAAVTAMIALPPQLPSVQSPDIAPAQSAALPAAHAARQIASYPAIAERPLFSPTRQPWSPPSAPPPPAPQQEVGALADYELVGVVVSDGVRHALIKPGRGGKTVMLHEGEQLEGWTLREISPQRVRFVTQDANYDMGFRKPVEAGQ